MASGHITAITDAVINWFNVWAVGRLHVGSNAFGFLTMKQNSPMLDIRIMVKASELIASDVV